MFRKIKKSLNVKSLGLLIGILIFFGLSITLTIPFVIFFKPVYTGNDSNVMNIIMFILCLSGSILLGVICSLLIVGFLSFIVFTCQEICYGIYYKCFKRDGVKKKGFNKNELVLLEDEEHVDSAAGEFGDLDDDGIIEGEGEGDGDEEEYFINRNDLHVVTIGKPILIK